MQTQNKKDGLYGEIGMGGKENKNGTQTTAVFTLQTLFIQMRKVG